MIGTKLIICIVIWLVTLSKLLTRAEEKLNNSQISLNETQGLNIFPGIKFFLTDGEITVHMRIYDLLQEVAVEGRSKERKNILERLKHMMMMTPIIMQILSLPGAIASIKMSLLKSLMVAQLAIAIMIYNLIKSTQSEEVVVYQPHHHKHFYHNSHYHDNEDEWFGR
ncbi:uncharacterized protein [Linepithema humile]|uniref:uncharacterized protein n=1 Tax=Linepithema humile TaxID=83485 RepID=UPI00062352FE|nr:PREDICTED: uncharacterized protein LOC105677080 [Linepithema humile]